MKKYIGIFISIVISLIIASCGNTVEPTITEMTVTGELKGFSTGIKQEVVKKEIVETQYVSINIEDELGTYYDVHYYDSAYIMDELIVGSTLTLQFNQVSTIVGEVVNNEYVGVSYTVDYTPLEYVIGYTSDQLLQLTYDWHYNEVHSEVTMEGIMTTNGLTMPYAFSDMITKESDGYVFHSVRTMSETVDIEQQNQSIVLYRNFDNGDSYMNINYEAWEKLEADADIDTEMNECTISTPFTEIAYYEEAGRYIIEGEMTNLYGDDYLKQLVTDALADYEYEPAQLKYVFRVVMDSSDMSVIFIDCDVLYEGVLRSPFDTLELSKFNILISNIAHNNTNSVLLPNYIEDSIAERNRPKFLCEAYYNIAPEDVTIQWLEDSNILSVEDEEEAEEEVVEDEQEEDAEDTEESDEEEVEVQEPKIDRNDIAASLIEILTTYTTLDVDKLIDYPLYELDGYEDVTELINLMISTYHVDTNESDEGE